MAFVSETVHSGQNRRPDGIADQFALPKGAWGRTLQADPRLSLPPRSAPSSRGSQKSRTALEHPTFSCWSAHRQAEVAERVRLELTHEPSVQQRMADPHLDVDGDIVQVVARRAWPGSFGGIEC